MKKYNEEILFSIVIPTYNRANILPITIGSVINQTYNNWELIIVDDGSTDLTKEVVKEFSAGDGRIRYYYQHNQERSAARNFGIESATGDYICFLDSDDEYLVNHLVELHKAITMNSKKKGIYVTGVLIEQNGERKELPFQDKAGFVNDISFLLLADETVIPARVAIEKKILESFQFNTRLRISEDTELFTRISCHYPLIQLKMATVVYKLHNDNTTNLKNNPFLEQLKALKMIFNNNEISKRISCSEKRKKLGVCYWGIARYHIEKRNKLKTIYLVSLSIFYAPTGIGLKLRLYGIYSVLIRK